MRKPLRFLTIAAFGIVGVAPVAVADEKVDVNALPLPVMKALETHFPNAQLLSAERDGNDDRGKYEIKLRFGEHRYEVDVSARGVLLEADRED